METIYNINSDHSDQAHRREDQPRLQIRDWSALAAKHVWSTGLNHEDEPDEPTEGRHDDYDLPPTRHAHVV
jgi:hypothetical protein